MSVCFEGGGRVDEGIGGGGRDREMVVTVKSCRPREVVERVERDETPKVQEALAPQNVVAT